MAFTKLIYHIVFRPKDNRPVIDEAHERDLYMYIFGFCKNHQCVLYRINGMPDHVHMCVGLHPTIAVASFVHDLKIATGNFMRSHRDMFPMFEAWERSYGAFTYSEADKERVIQYIINQKEHHRRVSTREELSVGSANPRLLRGDRVAVIRDNFSGKSNVSNFSNFFNFSNS